MSTTNLMPDDRRSLTIRLGVVQYLVAVVFAALAVAFWIFQIGQHEKFREMAENNRLRKLPLPAPRGVLLDRHGKVLVENQSTLNIALVREQTSNTVPVPGAGDAVSLYPALPSQRAGPRAAAESRRILLQKLVRRHRLASRRPRRSER